MKKYNKHDAMKVAQGFKALPQYAGDAILAAWDGCHKIYLAMDEEQAEEFREGYDIVVESADGDLVETVAEWFESSCCLRFVNAVWTNHADPNAGFVDIIAQGAE